MSLDTTKRIPSPVFALATRHVVSIQVAFVCGAIPVMQRNVQPSLRTRTRTFHLDLALYKNRLARITQFYKGEAKLEQSSVIC